MKRLFFVALISCALILIPSGVFAASVAKVGTTEYETFAEALTNVEEGGTITLVDNTTVTAAATVINKDVTIDLNGFNLSAVNKVLTIQGATVNITGQGSIIETTPDYAPIYVKGSNVASDENYTVVTIGKDVTLVGWSGIFVTPYASSGSPYAYGVVVNLNGKINAVNDSGDAHGNGVYINGQIQDADKPVKFNINRGAVITSTGPGIYAAGYAKWEIDGASITGVDSGVGIKAGVLNVKNSTIKATGVNSIPVTPFGDGMNPSGAAIQIESISNYAGGMIIDIQKSTIISANSSAVYEYGNTAVSNLTNFSTSGSVFESEIFNFADFNMSNKISLEKILVKDGTYSIDPSRYIGEGFKSTYSSPNGNYIVSKVALTQGSYNITGTITDGEGASVKLKQGGVVLDSEVFTGDDIQYQFTNLKAGIYNIVVMVGENVVTKTVEIKDSNVIYNFTMPTVSSEFMIAGENTPNIIVNGLDRISDTNDVFLGVMLHNQSTLEEVETEAAAIKSVATGKDKVELFDFSLLIGDNLASEAGVEYEPLEIVVPYDLAKNSDVVVYRYHGGQARAFTKLTSRPLADYTDGTYYLDTTNNLVYIYTNGFSTYGIGSNTIVNPKTNDNILLYVGFGLISLIACGVIFSKKEKIFC